MSTQVEPLAYDVRTAAQKLGISAEHLRALVKDGRIKHVRAGRRILISVAVLNAFVSGSPT